VSGRGLARLAPVVLLLAAGLTACGGTEATPPAASPTDDTAVAVEVTRENDTFTPNGERVDLGINQPLEVTITSDVAGTFHIHSTPEQQIDYKVGTTTSEISINRPGVVELESHEPDSIIFQLEVR
jgi:predicted small lipoprotein YifL